MVDTDHRQPAAMENLVADGSNGRWAGKQLATAWQSTRTSPVRVHEKEKERRKGQNREQQKRMCLQKETSSYCSREDQRRKETKMQKRFGLLLLAVLALGSDAAPC